jgi:phosphatidylinositol alpha-mannosyltransferase
VSGSASGDRSLRVAVVSPYDIDVPGGVQSHVVQLADELRRRGDDVHVVAPGRRSRGAITTVGSSVRIPFNDSVAPLALAPTAVRRVRRALADLAPDVVHVHEPMVPMVSLAATTAGRAPTVGTFHAWSDRDALYRAVRPLSARVVAGLRARIAVSSAAAAYHAGALGVPPSSFRIIPNGVDVARFAAGRPHPSLAATPALLFVGRLEPRKGLADLVTAFVRVKQDHPDVRLYVVGEGPERAAAEDRLPVRLRDDVVFLGRVEQAELPRLYRSADLYVSPALGGESFGIVLAEAMAAGATVVASDIPGYRSVVRDGRNGVLVPPGDPATLARELAALLDDAARRTALAAQARRDVEELDWAVVAERVRAVYLEAIAG